MITVLLLLLVIALYVWYKKTHYNDSEWVKNRIKGRNDDQKAVIRYFCNEPSCLSKKPITDKEYEKMIINYLDSQDFKQKAMNKIGIDEDQVKEIEPIHFEGFRFGKNCLCKEGEDHKWRSSEYQITWIFFGDNQIYVYQNTFFMDEDGRSEVTEEYFYKDITNFTTVSDTIETPEYESKSKKTRLVNVDSNRFAISVFGDKFYCSMEQNEYTERAIQGMKAKLREKKS